MLILEKQGWKGYKQAKRASEVSSCKTIPKSGRELTLEIHFQTLKKNYQLLKLRPETDFDRVLLEDIGFSKKETVKETETEKGKSPPVPAGRRSNEPWLTYFSLRL